MMNARPTRLTASVIGAVACWFGSSDAARAVVSHETAALSGRPAPGFAAGVTYDQFSFPSVNDRGIISFSAEIAGEGVNASTDEVLYAGPALSPQLILRGGDSAPGTPVAFFDLPTPTINDAGQMAFAPTLSGSGVAAGNDETIYLAGRTAPPQLVAREGSQAAGAPTGVLYSTLFVPRDQ
jgi:hypothetical protein